MSISINPAYMQCPRIGRGVSLEQTEGQCRERHNCSDDECPLAEELGQNRFNRALGVLATNIGQGWAIKKD